METQLSDMKMIFKTFLNLQCLVFSFLLQEQCLLEITEVHPFLPVNEMTINIFILPDICNECILLALY
jgi:hypothetical protein